MARSLFRREALCASEDDLTHLRDLQLRGLRASGTARIWPTRSAVMLWAVQVAARASDEIMLASLASSPSIPRGRPKSIAPRVPAKPISFPLLRAAWAPLAQIEKRYRQWRPAINRGGVLRAMLHTLDALSDEDLRALVRKKGSQ